MEVWSDKMKKISLFVTLLILTTTLHTEIYNYIETTADKSELISVNITDSSIELDTSDDYHTIYVNDQLETLKWITYNKEKEETLEISRTPELFKKDIPWYQTIHQLGPEVKKGNKKIIFYITSSNFDKELSEGDGIQVMEFKAIYKKRVDDLDLYYITFNDYRSIFWKSKAWFRPSDGVIVQYSAVRGAPGTPETVGQLKNKELANIY